MRELPRARARGREQQVHDCGDERGLQAFWQWFAVGVLLVCWIAEATLCAQRGF